MQMLASPARHYLGLHTPPVAAAPPPVNTGRNMLSLWGRHIGGVATVARQSFNGIATQHCPSAV
jgi:hypothetical protein